MINYMFSVAFQFAGAIMLILWCFGNTDEGLKHIFKAKDVFAERDSDNEDDVKIDRGWIVEKAKGIYLSRMSAGYILVGFILDVFSERGTLESLEVLVSAGIITIILLLVAPPLSEQVAISKYKGAIQYNIDEIDVVTTMTNNEIDEIMNGYEETES